MMDRYGYLRLGRLAAVINGWIAMIIALGFHRNQILAEVLDLGAVAGQYLFFTMQANLLAVIWWTWAALCGKRSPESEAGRIVRGALTLYMLLTGIIYAAILCRVYAPGGIQAYVNITHHGVTPVLFCVDWVITERRGSYRWRWIAAWALYPLGYLSWVIRLGARTRFYVYPFLDAGYLGAGRVVLNCVGMLLFMILLGAGMVCVNKKAGLRNDRENRNVKRAL